MEKLQQLQVPEDPGQIGREVIEVGNEGKEGEITETE